MPRDVPARDVMTTEVVTFAPDEPIIDAMQRVDTDRSDRPREDVTINSVTITVAD